MSSHDTYVTAQLVSKKCPWARNAKSGPCEAPDCHHLSGERRRICPCCLRRLGTAKAESYTLKYKFAKHADFAALEDACLEALKALGPKPKRAA